MNLRLVVCVDPRGAVAVAESRSCLGEQIGESRGIVGFAFPGAVNLYVHVTTPVGGGVIPSLDGLADGIY
eukprot:6580226-Pyramimonas_sp.AAC.1